MRLRGKSSWDLSQDRWEKYSRINSVLAKKTGIPMHINSGIRSYGRFRYADDGFVYTSRRKSPIGRYLRIEHAGGWEVALKCGRLDGVKELEALRWRLLQRLSKKLVPEMKRRIRVVRRQKGKKRFTGYFENVLYELRWDFGSMTYAEVDVEDNDELGPLDRMGRDWTPKEDDDLAAFVITMSKRLDRARDAVNKVDQLLLRALDLKIDLDASQKKARYGDLVEVIINGRRYMNWIGQGGFGRTREELVLVWPSVSMPSINFDELPKKARYEVKFR